MALREVSEPRSSEILAEFPDNVELTVVSNRGPIECRVDDHDGINHVQGAGGVAAALSYISTIAPITWVFSAMTPGDRRIAKAYDSISSGQLRKMGILRKNLKPHFVVLPLPVYRKHYEQFSNRILWFLQHYMWNSPYEPQIDSTVYDAWHKGYIAANQLFADKVVQIVSQSKKTPVILLQDYHLYLTPKMIRRDAPSSIIEHFTHIPWPEPRYWEMLPFEMRDAIFRGLLAADIVGFQTRRDARNFLDGCLTFLKGARIDRSGAGPDTLTTPERNGAGIVLNGHLARVRTYPISVDPDQLRRRTRTPKVRGYAEQLRALSGEKTIVRVDRLEPSKNLIRGLQAFELLLSERPELVGRVKLLLFLVPSRESVLEYRRYRSQVMKLITSINQKYGDESWHPIEVFYENNYDQALAGLTLYDVLLVNPLIDGMNLVAKEGPIVNTKNGVLILSEGAGAYQQLEDGVLSVAAADIEGTKRALQAALEMPFSERHRRVQLLRTAIEREDLRHWFATQIEDILGVLDRSRLPFQDVGRPAG